MATHPYAAADARLVEAAKGLHVLGKIAWPGELCDVFLEGWRAGEPKLPTPPAVEVRLDEEAEVLEELARPAADHPGATFVARTAASYLSAVRMLQAAGTPDFTKRSIELYGQPQDPSYGGGASNLVAAERFLDMSQDLLQSSFISDAELCHTPEHVRRVLEERCAALFGGPKVAVQLDPKLTSKAAAGAERIRLRSATCFTPADVEQLWFHEAGVHAVTALNGRAQPSLTCLSLGAPRTTATQEGLATFAELITGSIDLARLRRLALRVKAIDLALEGADFIEVFRFFLEAGQTERESYYSTARVFRGGDPRGGIAFTKDGVYLKGLLAVYSFLHDALAKNEVERTHYLFVGRLTCEDAVSLTPLIEEGTVALPRYEPEWLQNRGCLAAHLAFSALARSLSIGGQG